MSGERAQALVSCTFHIFIRSCSRLSSIIMHCLIEKILSPQHSSAPFASSFLIGGRPLPVQKKLRHLSCAGLLGQCLTSTSGEAFRYDRFIFFRIDVGKEPSVARRCIILNSSLRSSKIYVFDQAGGFQSPASFIHIHIPVRITRLDKHQPRPLRRRLPHLSEQISMHAFTHDRKKR